MEKNQQNNKSNNVAGNKDSRSSNDNPVNEQTKKSTETENSARFAETSTAGEHQNQRGGTDAENQTLGTP